MSDAQDTAAPAGQDTSASTERQREPETVSTAERAANPIGSARREREMQARHDLRGEGGRYATKEDGKDGPKPTENKPAGNGRDGGEQQRQPGHVPHQALEAERRKRQDAASENETLRREIAELRGMVHAGQRQQPGAPPQHQQPVTPPEFWDDPNAAMEHRMRGALDPMQQRLEQQLLAQRTHFSRTMAVSTHGQEAVEGALVALAGHLKTNPGDTPRVEAQLSQSMDPVGDVVRWHKQQHAMQTYGADPEAYIKAEVERRVKEMQGGAQQQNSAPPPAAPRQPAQAHLPTSFAAQPSGGPRGGGAYGGPKSLSEMLPRG